VARWAALPAIFVLAGCLVFLEVLDAFFLSDDFNLLAAVARDGPWGLWSGAGAGFLRPLVSLSLYLDHRWYGLSPVGYHLVNLVLHAFNACFVVVLSRLLTDEAAPRRATPSASGSIAFVAGALFLLHPSHSEAVSWISGRTDLLATFFFLGALCGYVAHRRRRRPGLLAASIVGFAAALLCKESVVILPLLLVLYELFREPPSQGPKLRIHTVIRGTWPFFVVLAGYFVLRQQLLGTVVGGYGSGVHFGISPGRLMLQSGVATLRAFLPAMPLGLWYLVLPALAVVASIPLVLTAVASGRVWLRASFRRTPRILWYLPLALAVSLIPVVSLGVSPTDTRGERLLYLPTVFSVLLAAHGLALAARTRTRYVAVGLGLLALCTLGLMRVNANWRQAGEISAAIVTGLEQVVEDDQTYILNLPDNLRGAYIFRNGLEAALEMTYPDYRGHGVTTLSYHNLIFPADEVLVTPVESAAADYHVRLGDPRARFVNANAPIDSTFSGPHHRIVGFDGRSFDLVLDATDRNRTLLYYSAGTLISLEAPPPQ
jgi:hypothetical protein